MTENELRDFLRQHCPFENEACDQIEEFLLTKLPDILKPEQKIHKIKNLLTEMRAKDGSIQSIGKGPKSQWKII